MFTFDFQHKSKNYNLFFSLKITSKLIILCLIKNLFTPHNQRSFSPCERDISPPPHITTTLKIDHCACIIIELITEWNSNTI